MKECHSYPNMEWPMYCAGSLLVVYSLTVCICMVVIVSLVPNFQLSLGTRPFHPVGRVWSGLV